MGTNINIHNITILRTNTNIRIHTNIIITNIRTRTDIIIANIRTHTSIKIRTLTKGTGRCPPSNR